MDLTTADLVKSVKSVNEVKSVGKHQKTGSSVSDDSLRANREGEFVLKIAEFNSCFRLGVIEIMVSSISNYTCDMRLSCSRGRAASI